MAELGPESGLFGPRYRGLEASQLFGILVGTRIRQEAPDPAHRQPALALILGGTAKEFTRQALLDPVSGEAGVDFELNEGVTGDQGRAIELGQCADTEIDAGIHGGLEVSVLAVQPTENWQRDPRRAQCKSLRDVDDPEPLGTRLDGCGPDLDRTMAVGIGFDHDHGLRWRNEVAKNADVGP
jgi:hypothetical protein